MTSASLVLAVILDHWYTSFVVTVPRTEPPIETVNEPADNDAIFTVTIYLVASSTVKGDVCSNVAVLHAVCVASPLDIVQLAQAVHPVHVEKSPSDTVSLARVHKFTLFASYNHLNIPLLAIMTP